MSVKNASLDCYIILQIVLHVSATFHTVSCFLPLRVYTPWWDRLYLLSFSWVSLVSPTWQLLLWISSSLQQALYISSLFTPLPQVLSKCFQVNESINHSFIHYFNDTEKIKPVDSLFIVKCSIWHLLLPLKNKLERISGCPKKALSYCGIQYNSRKCYLMLCLMESRLPWWLRQ